ncbi:MAG TPA: S41 family peptidase [Oceanobacillus sp.]|nr:S41 family peptidase [Oceanobacillus sp.]
MRLKWLAFLLIGLLGVNLVAAQDEIPPAEIVNDEGGPVVIRGTLTYTNVLFTAGVAQPVIILEDQGGFVERNKGFLLPPESQVLGQLTSDFYSPPVSYSLSLPGVPQGTLHDVDNDDEEDVGVQIFAIAYWTNIFGDPYLEERDLFGGGWSNAYASTRSSEDLETSDEIVGGKFVVYAPDDQQGFPSSFGEDGFLFTGDEPTVLLPQGYTVVDMDTDPFTFDRSREPIIDLIEPELSALDDFSNLSYTEAFDAMLEKFRTEYPFTEYKGIDWDAMEAEFRPRFEEAEANSDVDAYLFAMRDFVWAIPDGHMATYPGGLALDREFLTNTAGGLGMAIGDVDDGRTLVYFLTPGGPAEEAGIELGAEILEINGVPTDEAVEAIVPYSSPFSNDTTRRLQQLRYVLRSPLGTDFEITYQNPGAEAETVTLTSVEERASFAISSFNRGVTGIELPVEFELLDSGYGYVKINSFFDNELLTVQLWERMIQTLKEAQVPAIIIDMRNNAGGSGFLADQMAAYFFDEPLVLGNGAMYDEATGDFYVDPNTPSRFYLPSEDLRYHGEVAVLVGPSCSSACEFFAYDMSLEDRAAIVGQYPTGGMGGGVEDFAMPEGQFVRMPVVRSLDVDGNIIVEGPGVVPTVQVPVTLESLISADDVVLEAAVEHLDSVFGAPPEDLVVQDAGEIAVGDEVTGEIDQDERIRYTLVAEEDVTVTITLDGEDDSVDPYLRIYDADENLLTENDDIQLGVQINSRIEDFSLSADETIIVEVGTYDDGSSGTYTLTISEAASE